MTAAAEPVLADRAPKPTVRLTASTITDDQLDALYARAEDAEAERDQTRASNQRLNLRCQRAESRLATFIRAVGQWNVSERGTYISLASLHAIGRAAGVDIHDSVRHLAHFQRVEQAEAAIARVRALHRKCTHGPDCVHCIAFGPAYDATWPCPTVAALDGPSEPRTAPPAARVPPVGLRDAQRPAGGPR